MNGEDLQQETVGGPTIPVTIDTFVRAEADRYFTQRIDQGAFGQFVHDREPTPVDRQPIIQMNRDTLYSLAVFDLTTPVTIVKPDTHGRFQSLLVINQITICSVSSTTRAPNTFTQEKMGSRYIQMNARTLVDPNDIDESHTVQDGLEGA